MCPYSSKKLNIEGGIEKILRVFKQLKEALLFFGISY